MDDNDVMGADMGDYDDCNVQMMKSPPLTLLQRLERAHRRIGARLNSMEQELRHINTAIARLKEHPEDEAVFEMFYKAL
jgi:hypothetical protein